MTKWEEQPFAHDPTLSDPQAVSEAQIRHQLQRVLSSAAFRQSDRLRAFLQFSVDETVAGRTQSISAPTIALEVFGNGRDLDQKSESLVRVQARQLRLKLNQYYDIEGSDDPVRIDIPSGGYVANFKRRAAARSTSGVTMQPVSNVAITIDEFEYEGNDLEIHSKLRLLRHHVAKDLSAFDFLAVSAKAGVRRQVAAAVQDPSALVITAFIVDLEEAPLLVVVLASASSHRQIWSHQFSLRGEGYGSNNWPTEIARHIAANVAGPSGPAVSFALEQFEKNHQIAEPMFFAVLKGYRYIAAPTAEAHAVLRDELEPLLDARPHDAAAMSVLARLYCDEAFLRYNPVEREKPASRMALELAQAAATHQPNSSSLWCNLAFIRYGLRELDRACAAAKHALDFNRNDTDAMAVLGACYWAKGDVDTGLAHLNDAVRLNDQPPHWYKVLLVHEDIRAGRFDKARDLIAEIEMGTLFWVCFLEAVIFGHLGRAAEFKEAYQTLETNWLWVIKAIDHNAKAFMFPPDFIEQCCDGFAKGRRSLTSSA